jgi:hypothetical protein
LDYRDGKSKYEIVSKVGGIVGINDFNNVIIESYLK